jgi:GNAT superfamily N-acetyltransferase
VVTEPVDTRGFVAVPEADQRRAIDTLVTAFATDPVIRWLYAEPWRYLAHYGDFVETFGGQAFGEGTAWVLGDFRAAAVWLAPTSQLDEDAIVQHLERTVAPDNFGVLLDLLGQMDAGHPPEPHWYLAWIGVDAAMQGRGLGHELMTNCLQVVDADSTPVYLDNTNPRNVAFYERHGFRVTGQSQVGSCPPVIGMLRDAQ